MASTNWGEKAQLNLTRMKSSVLFFSLILSGFYAAAQTSDLISYTGNAVNWSHYTKTTKGSGFQKAFTYCGIAYSVRHGEAGLVAEFNAFLDVSESWVVQNAQTTTLLRHEQGIFDLTELYARKMRKAGVEFIKQQGANINFDALLAEVRNIYRELNNELFQEQKIYNAETCNGTNKEQQILWEEKIKTELKKLESFAS